MRNYVSKYLFDYRASNIVDAIAKQLKGEGKVPLVLDCIGSKDGSVIPISHIVDQPQAIAAVLLPVIVRSPSVKHPKIPAIYTMDAASEADWAKDVLIKGVRTHFYKENSFFKENLQPSIIPTLLAKSVIQPNSQYLIEASNLLGRAEKALAKLRSGTISGEKLVWKVWTEEEFPEHA